MSYLQRIRQSQARPPLGVQINWQHPLAQALRRCWIMNEGGGVPHDLVVGFPASFVGSPIWAPSVGGSGLFTNGSTSAVALGPSIILDDFTVAWYGIARTSQGGAGDRCAFACDDFGGTDEVSGRDSFTFFPARNSNWAAVEINVNNTGSFTALGHYFPTSRPIHIAFVRTGTTVQVYENGLPTVTVTVGSGNARSFQFPYLGCHHFSNANFEFGDSDHLLFLIANRPWSRAEVFSHADDPYQLLTARVAPLRRGAPAGAAPTGAADPCYSGRAGIVSWGYPKWLTIMAISASVTPLI